MLRLQNLINENDKKKIFNSSIRLLENMGYLCNHAETLEYFDQAGCKIGKPFDKPKGARQVLFTEEIIGEALRKIPSETILYPTSSGYQEKKLLTGQTYFESSGGDYVRDPQTHKLRPATMSDIMLSCRLIDALPNIDINGFTTGWMYDLMAGDDYEKYGLSSIYMIIMCLHSGKHASTVNIIANDTEIQDVIRTWQICAGGESAFQDKPCGSLIVSATSPFFLDGRYEPGDPWGHGDSLVAAAKAGVVLQIEPCGLLGGTGPVTVPGLVTQSLAEFMGLNVAAQAINPGNPVVLNDYTGTLSMATGQKQEAWPAANLAHAALAEMAHYINVPINCLSSSASIEADAQMGWENMGCYLSEVLAGVDIICSPGATSVDKVFDPLALLLANELIDWINHFTKGFEIDDEAIPVDLMLELGHAPMGGNFLAADHTLNLYKDVLWQPSSITNSLGRDAWIEGGEASILDRANIAAQEILAANEPNIPEDTQKALREFLAEILDREGVIGDEAKEILDKTYWQG